jgi:hypothetical protein
MGKPCDAFASVDFGSPHLFVSSFPITRFSILNLMKILRRNRLLLGWLMTLLVATAQISPPLRGAIVLWNPSGSLIDSGDWDTTTLNWGAGGTAAWVNANNDIAKFGDNINGPPSSVFITGPVSTGGLLIEAQNGSPIDFSLTAGGVTPANNTLNFAGINPTIKLKGSSNLETNPLLPDPDHVARIHAKLTGNQGLIVEFEDTAGTAGSGYGVLKLGQRNQNYASTLTGNITVKNKAGLAVDVSPSDLFSGNNPLGATNTIILEQGSKFEISGAKTSQGLSGRVFDTNGTGNTSRVDFTGTAVSTRIDNQLNNLSISTTNTAVQWLGKVEIGLAGGYTFFANADDGSRIFIDGQLVLNNDGGKGSTDLSSAPIFLSSGLHDIRVDYVQGGGGANINLGFAGPDTGGFNGQIRNVIPFSKLYQADVNQTTGASTALQLGNNLDVKGNALVDMRNEDFSSVQLGRLQIHNGAMLTVASTTLTGDPVLGNGAGFGKTLRFGGTSLDPTLFGTPASVGPQNVTIASDVNVAFDGVVSDQGRAMTIQKTGSGWLYFNQTLSANNLGASSSIQMVGNTATQTATFSSYDDSFYQSTLTTASTAGLSVGMTVGGSGMPAGTVIMEIVNGTTFKVAGNASALQPGASLTFSKNPTLVLTGAPGGNNPIGSAGVVLSGGNLVLDSKGATAAGMGPALNNQITVNQNAVIQSVANASTVTLGGNIAIAANKTLVLDAIAGGQPAADPGANLILAGGITGDNTTTLVIRSTQKNAGTTVNALTALANRVVQQTGFAAQSGLVTLTGNNAGFNGTLNFEPGANLRVEGVSALSGKTFVMAGGTLQLLDDGDGTGSTHWSDWECYHHSGSFGHISGSSISSIWE